MFCTTLWLRWCAEFGVKGSMICPFSERVRRYRLMRFAACSGTLEATLPRESPPPTLHSPSHHLCATDIIRTPMYVPWNWIIFCILDVPEHMILASTAHNNMVQRQIEYYTSFLQCPTCEKVWVRYYFSMKIQFVRFFRTPSLSLSLCVSVGRRDQRVCGGRLRD